MAGIIPAGYVAKAGEDIFPTTGPHLDVRVKKDGQYINPETWRSGLQRLKIGQQRTPLYTQTQGTFKPSFTVTSPFGPRSAPTAGASTFHRGVDFGIAGGTPLYWEGPGTFKPGAGLGTILTPEGFEVELLHTKGGKPVSLEMQQQTPQIKPPQQPAQSDAPESINIYIDPSALGQQEQQSKDPAKELLSRFVENMYTRKTVPMPTFDVARSVTQMPRVNYFA